MPETFDIVILGGGPGGYPAAVRARQLGMSVALVERHQLGGTCLNRGCIPIKALIRAARAYNDMSSGKSLGVTAQTISFDFERVQAFKNRIVKKLAAGTKVLMDRNGVDLIAGNGKLADANTVDVDGKHIGFKNLLIAVGSKVRMLPAFPLDGLKIISSDQALEIKELPKNIGIIGAGAIGMEFGYIFRAFGSDVTMLELLPRPLPMDDPDVSRVMWEVYKHKGIDIHCGFNAASCKAEDGGVKVTGTEDGKDVGYQFDMLLVSIGREACTLGCNFEGVGIEMSKGAVVVDDTLTTNIPHIHAVGDCARPPLLANKASSEGVYVVEKIAGHKRDPINYDMIPAATYTWPEVGSVGISEETAGKRGMEIRTATFSLAGNGKALIEGSQEGFIKGVAEKESGRLIGISIVGPHASELMSAAVFAVRCGIKWTELAETCFVHPTVGEAFGELGHTFGGGALHLPPG